MVNISYNVVVNTNTVNKLHMYKHLLKAINRYCSKALHMCVGM